jgi:hypothetical protein
VSNSLTELNGFSTQSVTYSDDRPYTISFSSLTSTINIAVDEDVPFSHPVGTNITSIVSQPSAITYTIDLTGLGAGFQVDWGALPVGVSVLNPGGEVHAITGTFSAESWNAIKSPRILPKDQATNFSYTSSIQYPDPDNPGSTLTRSWGVNATVTASEEFSAATPGSYLRNSGGVIVGAPQILDAYSGPGDYVVTVTPSTTAAVATLASTGIGGSSVFNSTTRVLTLIGNRDQVNSHLNNIFFVPQTNYVLTFDFTYSLTNPISGLITNRVQSMTAQNQAYSIGVLSYLEDTPVDLDYQVTDPASTGTFTITLTQSAPTPATGYFLLNSAVTGNTVTWSGTKSQVNAANVFYQPPLDWTGNITISVTQTKVDNGQTFNQHVNDPWTLQNSGTNPEIANMISRSYTSNTVNNIFAVSTPQIQDGADIGQTYTITLSSNLGRFGNSASNAFSSSSYSFTGNLTQCNAEFSSMVFLPNYNTSSSGTFNYQQSRNGVQQANLTLGLTGSVGTAIPTSTTIFTSNGAANLTIQQVAFANIQILTVGGGGGGAGAAGNDSLLATVPGTGGGGGGGGQAQKFTFTGSNIQPGTYNVLVGTGGSGNIANALSAQGGSGQSTYLDYSGQVLMLSQGGTGGIANNSNPALSSGGNTTNYVGGIGGQADSGGQGNALVGGGGAGSAANGGAARVFNIPALGGIGGIGFDSTGGGLFGPSRYYGGGGGGGLTSTTVAPTNNGGQGGGGAGNGTPGVNGTGGGGGGATWFTKTGGNGNGGSGIVVIKIN